MELLLPIGFYAFGLLTGMLFWEARWRFKMSIVDNLSGKDRKEPPPALSAEHKTILLYSCAIVLVVSIVAGALLYGYCANTQSRITEIEVMTKQGYKFQPYLPAGWYGPKGSGGDSIGVDARGRLEKAAELPLILDQ